MKMPKRLQPLVSEGMVDEVLRQLMSGKEATVYIVRCGEHIRCAKVYKDATQRSFRKSVSYQEGRKTKNSRQARAMDKGSRYGRQMQEEAWQSAEVDALYRLAAAGVAVPRPYICHEGVLLMDLVTDADGHPAPRRNDIELSAELALEFHAGLLGQVVRMLCAGIIHGDLSEYNILVGSDGPVIGLNLCPFAKSVHVKGQIRCCVSAAQTEIDSGPAAVTGDERRLSRDSHCGQPWEGAAFERSGSQKTCRLVFKKPVAGVSPHAWPCAAKPFSLF